MFKRYQRHFILFFIFAALVVMNQNCGKTNFNADPSMAASKAGASDPEATAENTDDAMDDIADNSDTENPMDPVDPSNPTVDNNDPGSADPVGNCDIAEAQPVEALGVTTHKDQSFSHVASVNLTDDADEVKINDVSGDVQISKAQEIEFAKHVSGSLTADADESEVVKSIIGAVDLRSMVIRKVKNIHSGTHLHANSIKTVKNIRGPVCVMSNSNRRIKRIKGNLKVIGYVDNGKSAKIGRISSVYGDVYLENVTVDRVSHVGGKMYLKNSTVKSSKDIAGGIVQL